MNNEDKKSPYLIYKADTYELVAQLQWCRSAMALVNSDMNYRWTNLTHPSMLNRAILDRINKANGTNF